MSSTHNHCMLLQERISLKEFNTFGIEAQGRYYIRINNAQQLRKLLSYHRFNSCPRLILGGGSNVLFLKDFEGIVFHMAIEGITTIQEDREYVWVKAGAGVNWHTLVLHCIEHGYAGIENLSLIPGTVGAAPVQNIGAYGVEFSNVFSSLEALEMSSGEIRIFDSEACAFGYRESLFKSKLQGQYIILNVTLKLHKKPNFQITYSNLQSTLKSMGVQTLSIKSISDVVIHLRQRKLPDPTRLGNAGSFFKNPNITQHHFKQLKHTYPKIPGYTQAGGQVKMSAAWFIEQCSWKGQQRGKVGVHDQHALVLVNYGGGTGQAIYRLAQDIQQSVKDRFGVTLIPEVRIID